METKGADPGNVSSSSHSEGRGDDITVVRTPPPPESLYTLPHISV